MRMFGRKKKQPKINWEHLRILKNAMDQMDKKDKMEKPSKLDRVEKKLQRKTQKQEPIPPPQYDEPDPEMPKMTADQKQEYHIMGKYLLKELPLFKYEIIIYLGMMMMAVMLYVADNAGIIPGILGKIAVPATVLPLGIWFVKHQFYMPRKNRVPSMRIYKSGVIELGVDDISKGYITYGKGENIQRKYVTRLAKHTEASTGKPFLVTSELFGENIDLINEQKPDMRSEEFNSILEAERAATIKSVMNRAIKFMQPNMNNPMFIMLLITLFGVIAVALKIFGVTEMLSGG